MTGNLRFIISKENFEQNKAKFAAAFDGVAKDDRDKGKFYLLDMPLESLPNTFAINNRSIEIDSAATDEKSKATVIYTKLAVDLNPYAEIKIFAFMIERYQNMKDAMITAVSEMSS